MKKYKYILLGLIVISMTISGPAFAKNNIYTDAALVVNGTKISSSLIITNGRSFAPTPMLTEALKAKIQENESTNTVVIQKGDTIITYNRTTHEVKVNGNLKRIQEKPIWTAPEENTTASTELEGMLFPVRFVSETLGAEVGWNNQSKTVYVDSSESYEIIGTVSRINEESEVVFLNLSKNLSGYSGLNQIFIWISENTKIYSEQGERLSFQDIKLNDELKTDITGPCQESAPPICPTEGKLIVDK